MYQLLARGKDVSANGILPATSKTSSKLFMAGGINITEVMTESLPSA
jgi:hypothetical protein